MPNSGDSQNGYTWYDAPEDEKGQALPQGWYSEEDGSFGGAGAAPTGAKGTTSQGNGENITAQSLYEQETGQTWPPQEPEYPGSKKMVPDKAEMRYWQTQAFAQRKVARDAKAAEAKALEERTYKESQTEEERRYKEAQAKATAEAKQPSVNDALNAAFKRGQESGDFTEYQQLLTSSRSTATSQESTGDQPILWTDPATGQQWFKSSETDQWQRGATPPEPTKTPTIDDLIIEAILGGNNDAAMALWDFANMPSQAERLKLAIAASQSPADYLATVGMMRGEIPISQQPTGSYRLGPESQAFAAYGVGGQGGGGQGAGGGPLQDPALQAFIKSRGGGEVQTSVPGGQTALPGATGGQQGQVAPGAIGQNPALDLIDRQIQALVTASDTAETPEDQAQIQERMTQLQTQRQLVWQQQQGGATSQGVSEGGNISATSTKTASTKPAFGPDSQAMDAYQASLDAQRNQRGADGLTTEQRWRREAGLGTSEGLGVFGPERDIHDPDNPNMVGVRDPYGTVRWVNKNDQDSIKWARYYTKPKSLPSSQGKTGNAGWDALSPSQQAYQRANGQSPESYSPQGSGTSSTLPSFLQNAYGKEVLSGAALKQRMSYPELAERQGVTVPRFRSAQARSMQTPLERRMFEAGLQQQGVDLPTWLEQEERGTTPGGSRRRRIQTGF